MSVQIIEETNDILEIMCNECSATAIISGNEEGAVDKMVIEIQKGVNPFKDGWEDGIGNTISCDCP